MLRLERCLAAFVPFLLAIACGGDAEDSSGDGDGDPSGDGDSAGDGDATGDGDGDSAGDGDATGDGDGDGDSSGDGDVGTGGGDGDGDGGSGGTSSDGDGDGDTGSGGAQPTGICFDQSCAGDCVPVGASGASCSGEWDCLNVLLCTDDNPPYCGCDGETFRASSSCTPNAYAYEGECDHIEGGLNCDQSQVMTDGPTPECPGSYVPQVINGHWGECVHITECGCEDAFQCGDGSSYACYNTGRCGDHID